MKTLFSCYSSSLEKGLCVEYPSSQVRKTFEFACSSGLSILIAVQLAMVMNFDSWIVWPPKTKHIMYAFMLLAALFNALHAVLYEERILFILETFFYNLYFVTIVFYFSNKLFMTLYKRHRKQIIALRIGYAVFIVLYVVSVFTSEYIEDTRCQRIFGSFVELWLLAVKWINIVIAIVFLVMGQLHERKQNSALINFENIRQYNNPLPQLRWWIWLNVVAQTVACIISIVFVAVPAIGCRYDRESEAANYIIAFASVVITFYLSVISTLYVFWVPFRKSSRTQRPREQTHTLGEVQLELVNRQKSPSFS